MKKCGNEYPSQYYFKVPNICNDCFAKMPEEEQKYYEQINQVPVQYKDTDYRIGFGRRLGAALIDSAIILVVISIIFYLDGLFSDLGYLIEQGKNSMGNQALMEQYQTEFSLKHKDTFLFANIIILIYYSLEIFIGASLGKIFLELRIALVDRKQATIASLFLRYIFKYLHVILAVFVFMTLSGLIDVISQIFSLLLIIGFFFTLGEKRQAFHDMLSGTAVYHKSDIKSQES